MAKKIPQFFDKAYFELFDNEIATLATLVSAGSCSAAAAVHCIEMVRIGSWYLKLPLLPKAQGIAS